MRTVLALAFVVSLTGCAGWGPGRTAAAVATFGMSEVTRADHEAEIASQADRQSLLQQDVRQCVAEGGDPVGCRQAVYGSTIRVTR